MGLAGCEANVLFLLVNRFCMREYYQQRSIRLVQKECGRPQTQQTLQIPTPGDFYMKECGCIFVAAYTSSFVVGTDS